MTLSVDSSGQAPASVRMSAGDSRPEIPKLLKTGQALNNDARAVISTAPVVRLPAESSTCKVKLVTVVRAAPTSRTNASSKTAGLNETVGSGQEGEKNVEMSGHSFSRGMCDV